MIKTVFSTDCWGVFYTAGFCGGHCFIARDRSPKVWYIRKPHIQRTAGVILPTVCRAASVFHPHVNTADSTTRRCWPTGENCLREIFTVCVSGLWSSVSISVIWCVVGVQCSSMWSKKPIRCHSVLYLFHIALRTPQWTHNQPTGSDRLHNQGTTPHVKKYH